MQTQYTPRVLHTKRRFDESSEPRTFALTHSAVSPNGLSHATHVRAGGKGRLD
jgi:hypothetical protein